MRGRNSAGPEHVSIAELSAHRFAIADGARAIPGDDLAEFLSLCVDEDAGFAHAAGGEALDGAMRLSLLRQRDEDPAYALP